MEFNPLSTSTFSEENLLINGKNIVIEQHYSLTQGIISLQFEILFCVFSSLLFLCFSSVVTLKSCSAGLLKYISCVITCLLRGC